MISLIQLKEKVQKSYNNNYFLLKIKFCQPWIIELIGWAQWTDRFIMINRSVDQPGFFPSFVGRIFWGLWDPLWPTFPPNFRSQSTHVRGRIVILNWNDDVLGKNNYVFKWKMIMFKWFFPSIKTNSFIWLRGWLAAIKRKLERNCEKILVFLRKIKRKILKNHKQKIFS